MDEAVLKQKPINSFKEGFEGLHSYADLFPSDWSRWHEISLQNNELSIKRPIKHCMINIVNCITNETLGNYLAIENGIRRRGKSSLKFYAAPFSKKWFGDSRIAIRRQLFDFGKGDELYFTGWFYFQGPSNVKKRELDNLNQSMFLAFRAKNEGLRTFGEPGPGLFFSFRNSIGLRFDNWLPAVDEVHQDLLDRANLPLNEWVKVKMKLKLSDKKSDGFVEVWMNDKKIIAAPAQTLPRANMKYSILELGVVSNLNLKESQTMYVDNILVSDKRFDD